MPLSSILSVQIRPDKVQRYRALASEFTQRAVDVGEELKWTAHEAVLGTSDTIHYVSMGEDFAELSERGLVPELFVRVLGEGEAASMLQEVSQCIVSQRQEISIGRPELSYLPTEPTVQERPWTLVTVLDVMPGQQDACEELLRKVAEAIPKANPEVLMSTSQPLIGDLGRYWTIRPMTSMAELDRQLPPAQLLTEAFGAAEGGLIYRSGLAAIAHARRSVVHYRPELSNPR